jgi:dTDP-4-dehydrorhamnose reductase
VIAVGATSLVGVALARRPGVTVVHCRTPSDGRTAPAGPSVQIEDAGEVAALVRTLAPRVVLYCHAVCDVGRCEDEPAWAEAVNVGGVRNLLAALEKDVRLVYVSSDHVFGDDGVYDEASPPAPISVYGRTRVAAEQLALAHANAVVVRAGLAVGPSHSGRAGHMDWLRYRAGARLPITIVADEARSAVWADELAERLLRIAAAEVRGVRHVPAARLQPRPELARHLMRMQGLVPRFTVALRRERPYPHLGQIELATRFSGELAAPLPAVVQAGGHVAGRATY